MNETLSDSVTEKDILTDETQDLKDEDKKKRINCAVVWRYFDYLKFNKEAEQHALQTVESMLPQRQLNTTTRHDVNKQCRKCWIWAAD